MLIAKLITGKIVLVLKPAQSVQFSPYKHVLVSSVLNEKSSQWDLRWVLETTVTWYLNISGEEHDRTEQA